MIEGTRRRANSIPACGHFNLPEILVVRTQILANYNSLTLQTYLVYVYTEQYENIPSMPQRLLSQNSTR